MRGVDIRIATLAERDVWNEIHKRGGVPSHALEFNAALTHSGIVPRLALVAQGEHDLVLAFYERDWHGHTDIATTQTVSGAAMTHPDQKLLDGWAEYARTQGWVAGYVQLSPDIDVAGLLHCTPGNRVFQIDVGADDWMAKTSAIVRRKSRQAVGEGVRLFEGRGEVAAALVRLYPETMARQGAGPHYRLEARTLEDWVRSDGCLALAAGRGPEIEAVVLFPYFGKRAEYHVGCSTEAGRDLAAWLLCETMTRLRARGVETVNLGGGVAPGDGLYQFKARFGGRSASLHAVRQIYRPDVYEDLCRRANADPGETWFPAYRARR